MKRKRFSVEQMVAVLKQAEVGVPVVEVCRQVGITEQTVYRWKKLYVGLQSDQVRKRRSQTVLTIWLSEILPGVFRQSARPSLVALLVRSADGLIEPARGFVR